MEEKSNFINLTSFLTPSLAEILSYAGAKALNLKHASIEPKHIAQTIINNDEQTKELLKSIGLYTSIKDSLDKDIKTKNKWKTRPKKIEFTKEVKQALMNAVNEALKLKANRITPLTVFLSLSELKLINVKYTDLVKSLNISNNIGVNLTDDSPSQEIEDISGMSSDDLNKYIDHGNYIEQITRILFKPTKKIILLVGNDGIGKESTKYLLAQTTQKPNNILSNGLVYSINANKINPSNLPKLITKLTQTAESSTTENKTLVYITDLEIKENDVSSNESLTGTLLNSILQSSFWGIIPMNYSKYQLLMKNFTTLMSNTEIVFFEEPNNEDIEKILKNKYSKDTDGIHLNPSVIPDIVSLCKRYIHDKFLPENAINLIDDAFSQSKIDGKKEITMEDIKAILSQKTGIPMSDISEKEAEDLQNLEAYIRESVIGQDEAIQAIAKTIKRSRAGLRDPKRPIGSFLFLGPSGVGKTQLAKALSRVIYKDENAMIRLDMSEYTDSHTVDRLIGAPPGYVGYEEGGQLTNKVLKKPYSLILLDEVEKANPKVFDIFLQVLDDGRLTDGQGKTVDFKNTIIIMTSNLTTQDRLNEFFRPEFLNRIDQIIHFQPLSVEVGKSIVQLFIKDLTKRLEEKNIKLTVDPVVVDQIATQGISSEYGARPLRRMIEEKIEDPIVEQIISGKIKSGDSVTWNKI